MDWFRNKKDTKQPQEPTAPVISQPDIQTEDVSSRNQCLAQLDKLFAPVPSKGMAVKIYLENFKSLNQAFGYEYCEKLLSQITAYLKDISEVTVYRYIGVEFILILDGCTEGQASALADTVLERFENVWKVDNVDCLCSAQIGLCSYPEHSENTQRLLLSRVPTSLPYMILFSTKKLSAVKPLPAICRQLWKKMNWKYATVLLTI